jgi:hypothetical protein
MGVAGNVGVDLDREVAGENDGWFDVQAYSTRDRWEGPELHDKGEDYIRTKEAAISAAQRPEYVGCYEVTVVAYGQHAEHQPGETVFSLHNRPSGCDYNKPSVSAAEAAIAAHREKLGIDGQDSTQLFHLLLSIKEWAAASGVDFAKEEAAADRELLGGNLGMPAAERVVRDAGSKGRRSSGDA